MYNKCPAGNYTNYYSYPVGKASLGDRRDHVRLRPHKDLGKPYKTFKVHAGPAVN